MRNHKLDSPLLRVATVDVTGALVSEGAGRVLFRTESQQKWSFVAHVYYRKNQL